MSAGVAVGLAVGVSVDLSVDVRGRFRGQVRGCFRRRVRGCVRGRCRGLLWTFPWVTAALPGVLPWRLLWRLPWTLPWRLPWKSPWLVPRDSTVFLCLPRYCVEACGMSVEARGTSKVARGVSAAVRGTPLTWPWNAVEVRGHCRGAPSKIEILCIPHVARGGFADLADVACAVRWSAIRQEGWAASACIKGGTSAGCPYFVVTDDAVE